MGFVLSFHPAALDAFEYHGVSEAYEDEQGRIHFVPFGAASIRVFGVKVFSEESADWASSVRWLRYCQLITGGLAMAGFVVGAGFGFCLQRLTQRRAPEGADIQRLQGENSASARPPSV
jgi:hypothetical protein